eukprot:CAMPEP_0170425206 /NCGR_PEP_ID=MMETSP0117_2-20130122/37983_1 /TAXON_ID=400756 /ORGANISM="Durinskia baltica, Strain CSIRO CS-38" /LENGTH=37 /DNA_ID= /DNA_START= /DNA_END= /DNA_ORIENTATION=
MTRPKLNMITPNMLLHDSPQKVTLSKLKPSNAKQIAN